MQLNSKTLFVIVVVVIAAALRLVPHPPNFAPVASIALFSGALIANRKLAFLIPISVMLISDLIIGFYGITMVAVYLSFALIVVIGKQLKGRIKAIPVFTAALVSAILFFLVTNFAVWMGSITYTQDISGLLICYAAAVPFFHYSLAGNIFYCTILFGVYHLAKQRYPVLAK